MVATVSFDPGKAKAIETSPFEIREGLDPR
jgi:hypothetical protein